MVVYIVVLGIMLCTLCYVMHIYESRLVKIRLTWTDDQEVWLKGRSTVKAIDLVKY